MRLQGLGTSLKEQCSQVSSVFSEYLVCSKCSFAKVRSRMPISRLSLALHCSSQVREGSQQDMAPSGAESRIIHVGAPVGPFSLKTWIPDIIFTFRLKETKC